MIPRTKLLLFSDEPQLAVGAAGILSTTGEFDVVVAPSDPALLLCAVEESKPEVIVVDVIPGMTLALFSRLRRAAPAAQLVLWARDFSEEIVAQGRELGLAGFLLRTQGNAEFVDKLRRISRGDTIQDSAVPRHLTRIRLTPRESQLLTLLAQGLRNKEIASCLSISEGTVRIYLSRLYQKAGARDRYELALFAWKNAHCGQAEWDGPNAFVTRSEEERARPFLRSLVLVEPTRRRGYPEMAHAAGQR
jgi:two-component system, NarL family, nitrate/nitrite response regulator NarL